MNIKHLFLAAASLGVFAACSDYDPGLSENVVDYTDEELELIQEYTANFVERYGDIDPNHTWGFGELGQELTTRLSDPKSNMWIDIQKGRIQETFDNGDLKYYYDYNGTTYYTTDYPNHTINENVTVGTQPVYKYNGDERLLDFTIQDGKTIPGFPVNNWYLSNNYDKNDVNTGAGKDPYPYDPKYQGYYHCMFGNENIEHWFSSKEDLLAYAQEHRLYEIIPLGDVAVCNNLNDPEVADVYAEFSKEWTGTNPAINLTNYFVQQVWKGTATYEDVENHGTFTGGEHMDYLAGGDGTNASDAEHFYNFNYSDYSNGKTGMMRIYDSNTQNFSYHNSYKNATIWNRYRLVYLHGNWYVGFDFALEDGTYADHKYNDWIVKIVPGDGLDIPDEYTTETTYRYVTETRTNTASGRVMCEDLGTTNDFDFNDVVFDVTYTRAETRTATYTRTVVTRKSDNAVISDTEVWTGATEWTPTTSNGTWTGQITILASGGTLPIYVQNFPNGQQYECHETLLGTNASNLKVGEKYNPINVGANVDNISPVVLPPVSGLTSTDPDYINIYVHAPSSSDRATQTIVLPEAKGGRFEEATAERQAPQKILVPLGTKWMRESQQIEWTHTYFRNWVNKESSEYNFGGTMDWTTQGLEKTNLLY